MWWRLLKKNYLRWNFALSNHKGFS